MLPEHQRQGFATEITHELLRFAFDDVGAERVLAETHPDNPASNSVLEKLGFECLGERRHTYDHLPGFEAQVLWGTTRGSWRRGPLRRLDLQDGEPEVDAPRRSGLLRSVVGCRITP